MDISSLTPQEFLTNESFYLSQLENPSIWDKIPFLNSNELHDFKDLSLVRFRGMVQDMHGPEMYLEQYEVIKEDTKEVSLKNGKFLDIADCQSNERIDTEGPNIKRGQRLSFAVISTPALNQWVKQVEESKFRISKNVSVQHQKRPLEESSNSMEVVPTVENKKPCTSTKPSTASTVGISPEHLLNCPIPGDISKVCHLKVYKEEDDKLKLNTLCDFVGFLSMNPALAPVKDDELSNAMDFEVHNPPPSLIPRLHCFSYRILNNDNPLMGDSQMDTEKMVYVKRELLILFTQILCGDQVAAEMLIYYLISQVYIRTDLMAIGQLSLNLSNVPKFENLDFVQEVYKFIEMMVTKSHYLAMSLENMNEMVFVPKKDYSEDRLTSSILQLSPNTHLVLDETKLSPGKLNEAGVNAVKTISNAIKNQKIHYNFTYFEMEFDCDIPFLIFSEGKSLLPSDRHVKLQPDQTHVETFQEIVEAARHFLNPELLDQIRKYLTQARLTEYDLEEKTEMIQDKFVELREKSNVTGDDLHHLLVLAKLIAVSQGKHTLDEEDWKKACELDGELKKRINKR